MKFTFTCEQSDGTKITYETEKDTLDNVLFEVKAFLKGCGYQIDGDLEITENFYLESSHDIDSYVLENFPQEANAY